MTLSIRDSSNSAKQTSQMTEAQEKIEAYLAKKFRISRSYSTVSSYRIPLNRFLSFLNKKNTNIIQVLEQIKVTKKMVSMH